MAHEFPLLSLKLALRGRRAAPPPVEVDMSPVVDKLAQIEQVLGIISRAPRHVASP